MAHEPQKRAQVRASFVQGLPLQSAAEQSGISYQTARNWKRAAKGEGDDWDVARNARRLTRGGMASLTTEILEGLATQFAATLQAMQDAEGMEPIKQADMLLRLSDAYVKCMAAAARGNPKLDALSVAMDVLRELGDYVRDNAPDMRERMLELLEGFGPHIVARLGQP